MTSDRSRRPSGAEQRALFAESDTSDCAPLAHDWYGENDAAPGEDAFAAGSQPMMPVAVDDGELKTGQTSAKPSPAKKQPGKKKPAKKQGQKQTKPRTQTASPDSPPPSPPPEPNHESDLSIAVSDRAGAAQEEGARLNRVRQQLRNAYRGRDAGAHEASIRAGFAQARSEIGIFATTEVQRLRDALFGEAGVMGQIEAAAASAEREIYDVACELSTLIEQEGCSYADFAAEQGALQKERAVAAGTQFKSEAFALKQRKQTEHGWRKNKKKINKAISKLVAEATNTYQTTSSQVAADVAEDACELENSLRVQTDDLLAAFDPETQVEGAESLTETMTSLVASARTQLQTLYEHAASQIIETSERQIEQTHLDEETVVESQRAAHERHAFRAIDDAALTVGERIELVCQTVRDRGGDEADIERALTQCGLVQRFHAQTPLMLQRGLANAAAHCPGSLAGQIFHVYQGQLAAVTDAFIGEAEAIGDELLGEIDALSAESQENYIEQAESALDDLQATLEDGLTQIIGKVDQLEREGQTILADVAAEADRTAEELSSRSENFFASVWRGIKATFEFMVGFWGQFFKALGMALLFIVALVIVIALIAALVFGVIWLLGAIGLGALAAGLTTLCVGLVSFLMSTTFVVLLTAFGVVMFGISARKAWLLMFDPNATAGDIGAAWGQAFFDLISMFSPAKLLGPLKNASTFSRLGQGASNLANAAGATKIGKGLKAFSSSDEFASFFAKTENNASKIDDWIAGGDRVFDVNRGSRVERGVAQAREGVRRGYQKAGYKTPKQRAEARLAAEQEARAAAERDYEQGNGPKPQTPSAPAASLSALEEAAGDIGVPVVRNERISGVRVTYKDGVRIEVGPDALPHHVRLHVATAEKLKQYDGVVGWLRWLVDDVTSMWSRARRGRNGRAAIGSRRWEAQMEVDKLSRIRNELIALHADALEVAGELASRNAVKIQEEINVITRQLENYQRQLDEGVSSYARSDKGHVAGWFGSKLSKNAKRLRDEVFSGNTDEVKRFMSEFNVTADQAPLGKFFMDGQMVDYYDVVKLGLARLETNKPASTLKSILANNPNYGARQIVEAASQPVRIKIRRDSNIKITEKPKSLEPKEPIVISERPQQKIEINERRPETQVQDESIAWSEKPAVTPDSSPRHLAYDRHFTDCVIRNSDNTFTVLGHGKPGGLHNTSPEELASMIRSHPHYREGMIVDLWACHAGANGEARALSEILGGTVIGYTNKVYPSARGVGSTDGALAVKFVNGQPSRTLGEVCGDTEKLLTQKPGLRIKAQSSRFPDALQMKPNPTPADEHAMAAFGLHYTEFNLVWGHVHDVAGQLDNPNDLKALQRFVYDLLDPNGAQGSRNSHRWQGVSYGDIPDVLDHDWVQMLRYGGGVCRHQATLGHLILAKHGIRSRVLGVTCRGTQHAVLEVGGRIIDFNYYQRVYDSFDDYLKLTNGAVTPNESVGYFNIFG